jgi:signal transduction histidine kinase
MRLRRALTWSAVGLGLVTLLACTALVVFTTLLRQKVDQIDRTQQAAKVTSDLVHHVLRYQLETNPTGRALSEAYGRLLLSRVTAASASPAERARVAELTPALERFWATPPSAADGRPPAALLAGLVEAEQSRDAIARQRRDEAKTLDMVANVLGVAIAALLVAGVAFVLWWVRQFVFRPIAALAASVDRFAAGDVHARAPVRGALEIRRIAATQNEMADALARRRDDQLRFLATVIHDLRNPLAAVQLATGYITPERPLPPEPRLRSVFQLIDRQLRRLNSLVGDVLNAVQIDAGQLVLRRTVCDLGALAADCVALFRTMAPGHQFRLERDGETALFADATRLEQVLNNLVSNAVKYSPPGSQVEIDVRGAGDRVELAVSDDGPGVSPEVARLLFRPFSRGPSQHEEIAGVGLGLYVSKRIVEAHGGTLEVAPGDGPGATFLVTLPRRSAATAGVVATEAAGAQAWPG